MKKFIVFVITAALFAGLVSGCGQTAKAPTTGKASEQPSTVTSTPATGTNKDGGGNAAVASGGISNTIYHEPGSELVDFVKSITDKEENFGKVIESTLKQEDPDLMFAQANQALPDLILAELCMYDALSPGDAPKKEGKLMLSGFDAIREKSGNVIKISANHEYPEDTSLNKKGDKYSEQGSLDTAANTLKFESKTEREGKVIAHTVLEAVILKDGTHLMQYLNYGYRESGPPNKIAAFKRFNKDEYTALTGSFNGNEDFSDNSIIGKGDIQPTDMAQNCKVTGKFTVAGGKAFFTK